MDAGVATVRAAHRVSRVSGVRRPVGGTEQRRRCRVRRLRDPRRVRGRVSGADRRRSGGWFDAVLDAVRDLPRAVRRGGAVCAGGRVRDVPLPCGDERGPPRYPRGPDRGRDGGGGARGAERHSLLASGSRRRLGDRHPGGDPGRRDRVPRRRPGVPQQPGARRGAGRAGPPRGRERAVPDRSRPARPARPLADDDHGQGRASRASLAKPIPRGPSKRSPRSRIWPGGRSPTCGPRSPTTAT